MYVPTAYSALKINERKIVYVFKLLHNLFLFYDKYCFTDGSHLS